MLSSPSWSTTDDGAGDAALDGCSEYRKSCVSASLAEPDAGWLSGIVVG